MARPLRLEYRGALYHITSRGNARQDIYLDEVPLSQTVPTRPTKFEIIETISEAYGITIKELVERNNPEAYQTSVYLLRRVVNMDLKAVARTFGVSTARISRIQSDIEKDLKGRKKLLKLLKRYKVKN